MKVDSVKLEVEGATPEEVNRYREVLAALITAGGLSGVRGGKTILHFDVDGEFRGITLDYWVWKKRT